MTDRSCVLPWIGKCVWNGGHVTPCCRYNNPHDHSKLNNKNTMSGYSWKSLQREMVYGASPEGCMKCQVEDAAGVPSMRREFNAIYEDVDTSVIDTRMPPRYLELSFGNLCNLACRMCDTRDSTRWSGVARHLKSEFGFPMMDQHPEWRLDIDSIDVDLSHVDRLKFMGGEPMLHPDHELFLERLVQDNQFSGRITARYHTNATIKPSDRVLELWEQLGEVQVALSVDGVGTMNDYVRPPSKWAQVENIAQWYRDLNMPNLQIHCHTAVSILNCFDLHNLQQWTLDMGIRIWNRDIVRDPGYLFIGNAPYDYKHRLRLYLEQLPFDTGVIEGCCDMTQNLHRWKEFLEITKELDRYWSDTLQYNNSILWSYMHG